MDWNNKTQWQCLYIFDSCPSQKLEQFCYKPSKWKCKCMRNCRGNSDTSGPVGKEGREKAPLLIFVLIDHALHTWSLLNPTETLQLNMQCCLQGSFSAASRSLFPSNPSTTHYSDSPRKRASGDSLQILRVPARVHHVNRSLQKCSIQNGKFKDAWMGNYSECNSSHMYVQIQ